MCDVQGKKSQVYLAAVARLKQIFEIKGSGFEHALLSVVRKHCQGGKAPTLKKGTRRCRQTYKDLSTRPMYKEVFGGIVKVFKIKDVPRFYKDVGDVLTTFCELPELEIMEIKLEEMGGGNMPYMKGRVFKIEIDPLFRDKHTKNDSNTIKQRAYKIQWLDLDKSDPNENFLKNYDEMWRYMEHPLGKEKLNQFFLGDLDYRVRTALSGDKMPPALGEHTQYSRSRKSPGKMMKIKLEKMGLLPDMKGRVFTIERDERFQNVHVYHQKEKIKLKMFRMKWRGLKPAEKFLEKFDKMWTYRERPRGYIEKLGQFFLGDIKDVHKEYGIDFF